MNWGKEGKLHYRANHSKSFPGLCIFDIVATGLQTSHPNDLLVHTNSIFFSQYIHSNKSPQSNKRPPLNEGPPSIKPAETGNPTRVSVPTNPPPPPSIPLTSKNSKIITKKMMFCSHFIIVCDYNGINEEKQFSLWLSLSLCFCEVLKAVHCSDNRHKLFLLCWKLPCSGQLDKAPPLNECLVSRRFLEEISN